MPSPKHLCAHPGCATLVARKETVHCRKHHIKSPEHIAKIGKALKGRKFSIQHLANIRAAQLARGGGETARNRKCEWCGRPFQTVKPSAKQRFCSKLCGYMNRTGERAFNWQRDMPHLSCRVCNKSFRVHSRTMIAKRFCCSMKCKNTWQLRNQKREGTDIELVMASELCSRGIVFIPQVKIGRFIADFILPELRIAISCDGNFFHRTGSQISSDLRQTKAFENAGLKVYRFQGRDIHSNVGACIDIITADFCGHNAGTS